jgi:hypothetical protein
LKIASFGLCVILSLIVLQTGSSVSAFPLTTDQWSTIMNQTPTPASGCFVVSYPSTAWTPVPCGISTGPTVFYSIGGSGSDNTGTADNGIVLTSATGQVTSETTFVGECEVLYGGSSCYLSSDFSIQLNTNQFTFTYGSHSTTGWEQFIYGVSTNLEGFVEVQYWLLGYSQYGCPTNWQSDGLGNCVYTTSQTTISGQSFSQSALLAQLTSASLGGSVSSTQDKASFCY